MNGQSIYLGNPNGIVIKPKDGPSLYHMGDTDIFSDMALIAEIHAPKIGLVPVGDRFTMDGDDGGARGQTLFPLRDGRALPLRNLSPSQSGPCRVRRRHEWGGDQDQCAAHRRGDGFLKSRKQGLLDKALLANRSSLTT